MLYSQLDASVNFPSPAGEGWVESRYVRRGEDYFICYLSSHSGCNRGCGFCHLTTSGQTSFLPTSPEGLIEQATRVFDHYRTTKPARYVHFNFMARGEPLANPHLTQRGDLVLSRLGELAARWGLPAKFGISTIMPRTYQGELRDSFLHLSPTLYYSLYSVDEEFRSRWMPGAMPVADALVKLRAYQDFSKKIVKIHFALIEGENDQPDQIDRLIETLDRSRLCVEVNLVHYNPASPEMGRESPNLDRVFRRFQDWIGPDRVQTVPRVGFDVKASCGMFVGP